jgi:hypothetical protein
MECPMNYAVVKIGPSSFAIYGPFNMEEAHLRAAELNASDTQWVATVQPLYPVT